MQEQDNKQLYM